MGFPLRDVLSKFLVALGFFLLYAQYRRATFRTTFYQKIKASRGIKPSFGGLYMCPYSRALMSHQASTVRQCRDTNDSMLCLNRSKVSNTGVFSNVNIRCNTVVGTGIENIKEYFGLAYVITGLGRKINHCYSKSNVYLERDETEGKFLIVTIQNISRGDELFLNYRALPFFIHDAFWYFKDC